VIFKMGDRYTFNAKCAYCDKLNEEVYFAPTCGFIVHKCESCGKTNKIVDFKLHKMLGLMSGVWETCKVCDTYCELTGHLECSECQKELGLGK